MTTLFNKLEKLNQMEGSLKFLKIKISKYKNQISKQIKTHQNNNKFKKKKKK